MTKRKKQREAQDDDDFEPWQKRAQAKARERVLDTLRREQFWENVKMPESPWDVLKTYRAGETDGDEKIEK